MHNLMSVYIYDTSPIILYSILLSFIFSILYFATLFKNDCNKKRNVKIEFLNLMAFFNGSIKHLISVVSKRLKSPSIKSLSFLIYYADNNLISIIANLA